MLGEMAPAFFCLFASLRTCFTTASWSKSGKFACGVVARHQLARKCAAVLFSPVHDVLTPPELASWILADKLPVRLQLQAHKYIWGAHARGV